MRSAALIFGLLAGLVGGLIIVPGNLETGLAAVGALGDHRELIAKIIIYLIPNLGLLGAGLALARPRLGALFMLLSAAAWAIVALLAGHGAILFAAVPFTFAGAGGLVALFAARRSEREEADAPHRPAPDPGRRWDSEPAPLVSPRRTRAREEPLATPRRRSAPPSWTPVEPEPPDEEEEPLEDYVDADDMFDDEPEPYPHPDPEAEEQPEPDDYTEVQPEPPDYDDEPEPAPPPSSRRRRGNGNWSLPDPDEEASPRRNAPRNYAPERQSAPPTRRQAIPPAPPPEPPRPQRRQPPPPLPEFDIAAQDFTPPRRDFTPRPRPASREVERYDIEDDDDDGYEEAPRRSSLRGLLRLMIALVFMVVIVGLAVAIYFDYQRGSGSLLFGGRQTATASTPARAGANDVATRPETAPVDNTSTTDAGTQPVPLAPVPASAPTSFEDPFTYCNAVNTIDAPDARFTGPPVPHAISAALKLPDGLSPDQVHWRCASRAVLACTVDHAAACDQTPTVDLMVSYCAQHPGAQNIPAPNGSWSCNADRPVIPRDQKWPVDARGFFPGAWRQIVAAPRQQ